MVLDRVEALDRPGGLRKGPARRLLVILGVPGAGKCREPEVRTTIAASPIANFGFKAALES